MEIDKSAGVDGQAQYVAQKRKDVKDEVKALDVEKAQVKIDRQRMEENEREKTNKDIVDISNMGDRQVELVRKLNSDRVHQLDENYNKSFADLAAHTAGRLKELETQASDMIEERRWGQLEKIRQLDEKTADPFYHIRSLNPMLHEDDRQFSIQLQLPPHEAKNLYVTGEGQTVKLSLARRFEDEVNNSVDAHKTRTNSYQSVVEYLQIPGAFDPRGIKQEYKDGVVTVHVPKVGLPTLG